MSPKNLRDSAKAESQKAQAAELGGAVGEPGASTSGVSTSGVTMVSTSQPPSADRLTPPTLGTTFGHIASSRLLN
jgi:hypothetical protein